MPEELGMWTVYDHPADYPQGYIARWWLCTLPDGTPTETTITSPTLEALRAKFGRMGLTCLPRHPADDATIVECWL